MGKKKNKNLVEFDLDYFHRLDEAVEKNSVPIIAREIRNRVEKGTNVDTIACYKHEDLKNTLSYFRIADRSKATTKEEMAELLVQSFGEGNSVYGDQSRKMKKDKQKDIREDKFVYAQNEVIRIIKERGGL